MIKCVAQKSSGLQPTQCQWCAELFSSLEMWDRSFSGLVLTSGPAGYAQYTLDGFIQTDSPSAHLITSLGSFVTTVSSKSFFLFFLFKKAQIVCIIRKTHFFTTLYFFKFYFYLYFGK